MDKNQLHLNERSLNELFNIDSIILILHKSAVYVTIKKHNRWWNFALSYLPTVSLLLLLLSLQRLQCRRQVTSVSILFLLTAHGIPPTQNKSTATTRLERAISISFFNQWCLLARPLISTRNRGREWYCLDVRLLKKPQASKWDQTCYPPDPRQEEGGETTSSLLHIWEFYQSIHFYVLKGSLTYKQCHIRPKMWPRSFIMTRAAPKGFEALGSFQSWHFPLK